MRRPSDNTSDQADLAEEADELWPTVWRFLALMHRVVHQETGAVPCDSEPLRPPLPIASFGSDEAIQGAERRRLREEFERYRRYQGVFTRGQWEVLVLLLDRGLTQRETAEAQGVTQSAVSGCLKRAHQRLLTAEAQSLAVMRKQLKSC